MEADVIIVGGGPTGTIAAEYIAKRNKRVAIYERRTVIGEPDHCAGLLSTSGLKTLGLSSLPSSVIQNNKIRGAKFYSPYCSELTVQRKNSEAIVVDRTLFDQYLASRAKNCGASIITDCKINSISYENNLANFYFNRDKQKVTSQIGIIAEGGRGHLTKQILQKTVPSHSRLSGYQLLVENIKDIDKEFVELYLDDRIAPGFFCWIIPVNDSTAKVGLASREGKSVKLLDFFMNQYKPVKDRFIKSSIQKKYGGEVIVRGILPKTHSDGFLVVGDAAGQTKATTGGGVITGGIAAKIAARITVEAITEGENSSNFLKKYDNLWKQALLRQLKTMSILRWFLDHLSNDGLELIFKTILENNLISVIEEKGDIDKQAEIVMTLLKNPHIIKMLFSLIPEIKW